MKEFDPGDAGDVAGELLVKRAIRNARKKQQSNVAHPHPPG
jgi:hypothetical protein